MKRKPKAPQPRGAALPEFWTPARREAQAALWDAERRAREALRRKEQPQGNRSAEWWAKHPEARAAQSARMLTAHGRNLTLAELLAEADAAIERLRKLGGLL